MIAKLLLKHQPLAFYLLVVAKLWNYIHCRLLLNFFSLQFDSLNELLKPLVLPLYLACKRGTKHCQGT